LHGWFSKLPASPGREQISVSEPRGGLPNKFVDIWKNELHYFWFFIPVPGVPKQGLTSFFAFQI
jgi:hypothetical protein